LTRATTTAGASVWAEDTLADITLAVMNVVRGGIS
jgi:hypothetical protein